MTEWLLVVLGAAVGAPARWLVDQAVSRRAHSVLPWGTLTVNVVGSLLLGMLLALSLEGDAGVAVLAVAGTGFCGAFTTFSTFTYETVVLADEGSLMLALINVTASVLAALAAAFAGWAVVTALM